MANELADFQRLLNTLAWGENYKWFTGKNKLPNNYDRNLFNFDEDQGGLTSNVVQEIYSKIKGKEDDMLVIAFGKKEHKSSCKCDGCPIGEVEQYFVGYVEREERLVQTFVKVTWTNDMGGYAYNNLGYSYEKIEKTIFETLRTDENLLFTVGSNFGYQIISDSLN